MVNMCNLILIVINLNLKQDRQSDLCIFMAELDFRRQEKWNATLLRLSDTFFLLLSDRFFNILRHHQFFSSGSPTVTGQIGSDLNTSRSFCHSVLITHWICLRLRYSYNALHFLCVCVAKNGTQSGSDAAEWSWATGETGFCCWS